ncbi:MAG: response regulator transcription factor [Armatimonas sp.]
MTDTVSVLLVDDHALVRRGVRAFFETLDGITVVGEAESGEEAVEQAVALAPDVVLLDLILPGIDGVEATRRIRAASPRTQVILLTSFHDDAHVLPAIRAGALSYLLKDVGPDELGQAVRRAARGEATLHPRVAAQVMASLANPPAPSTPDPGLTEREHEVLGLIADGLSNAEIAEKLFVSEKTVKSHVSNILGKLHLADRTQAAVYAWREGLKERG